MVMMTGFVRASIFPAFTLVLGSVALLTAAPAVAAPVKWTLQNVVFADGGTATGSYSYDAATNAFSDINVVTTENPPFGDTHVFAMTDSSASVFAFTPTLPADLTGVYTLV